MRRLFWRQPLRCRHFLLPLLFCLLGQSADAAARNLSPAESQALLQKNPGIFVLDVRTPEEYRRSRIAGGHLIPIDQVERRLGEIPADRPILVYCAVGSRSGKAVDLLARHGYPEVYNLFGGIWGWQLAGYPTLSGGP